MTKFFFLTLLISIFGLKTIAQNKEPVFKDSSYWSSWMWGLRAGLGYQKTFYSELGISYHKVGGDVTIPQSRCLYSSIEWVPKILPEKENNILGFKVGGVYSASMGVFALEVKYQTDFKNGNDFVLTPKIGFGPWDVISILYGYNISTKHYPFSEIGKHQFSIICNLDRFFFQ